MRHVLILLYFFPCFTFAIDNWRIFPLDNYNQNVNYWLNQSESEYYKPLLSLDYQNKRLIELKHRYFGTDNNDVSPWNGVYITSLMNESQSIYGAQTKFLREFDNIQVSNRSKLGYGQNKRPYAAHWIQAIAKNLNLSQFIKLVYNKNNRAIAVNNLMLRILPTDDPFYYSDKIPGEGYPFDNLQNSVIYAGTPLYVTGKSIDGKWFFVISPDIAGWVHSDNVAYTDDNFIAMWQNAAYKALAGITKNNVSIKDDVGNYLFSAYVGTILPKILNNKTNSVILVPAKNSKGFATIKIIALSPANYDLLPLIASKANFAKILTIMQGRTYGWGNLDMYNDCSSELKNIYALFGIYVPRNTKSIDNAGVMVDLSELDVNERISYLLKKGVGLLTFIHINGHVVLYIGKYNKNYNGNNSKVPVYPLVYQQVWGLRDTRQSYRSIIGQSVFFPFITGYTEDKNIVPQSSFSLFRVIYLTEAPDKNYKPNLNELVY